MFTKFWLKLPIGIKVRHFAFVVILVIAVASALSIMAVNYAMGGLGPILDDNRSCQEFMSAVENEAADFKDYINAPTDANFKSFQDASEISERCLRALPYDYTRIGADRYAQTWNILNAYDSYTALRDEVIRLLPESKKTWINKLYSVYDMQSYMEEYSRRLLQLTVEAGTATYSRKLPFYQRMPFFLINAALLLGLLVFSASRLMTKAIVDPVLQLSAEAKKISENDFSAVDFEIPNQDELGELVQIFNRMKHSTENYINTLVDNHRMTELLQKEQMENMEMEKRLDQNRLELLKSQINPHFLFNTLNMIGSMANIEDADTTEKMINSLSALFRYNLSTKEQTVPLSQELVVGENYMFLQKMRFGSRIRYHVEVPEDTEHIIIPSFMLQPLLENAVVHGISKKEEGGDIRLRVVKKNGQIILYITDTGLGMPEEKLRKMRAIIRTRRTASIGIGLGNICQRVLRLYQNSSFDIYSRAGRGTSIVIRLPENGPLETERVSSMDTLLGGANAVNP